MEDKTDLVQDHPITDDTPPTVCPICNGIDSPHPDHEPNRKLGMSWWKRMGFNAPNACARALYRTRMKQEKDQVWN